MINLEKPCGIDLEWPRQKLVVIQDKFLHQTERGYRDNIDALCRVWLSKEVLFKLYGKKALSFKDEMQVKLKSEWQAEGKILKASHPDTQEVHIESVFNYLLAYSV